MGARRSCLILTTLVISSAFWFIATFLPENASATTLYVGGIGPGNYTAIQEAINASSPGDTVYVYNGTYYEHVTIDKTLSLVGENTSTTTIDGGQSGDVVYVTADWVNISGFTVTNGGPSGTDAGIKLNSVRNCMLTKIAFSNNRYGTHLYYSNYTVIANIRALNNKIGISLISSNDNEIVGNNISNNEWTGIYLFNSTGNRIADNDASWNDFVGIQVGLSDSNIIAGNQLFDNGYGIALAISTNNTLLNNTLARNGISLNGDLVEHWNSHTIDTSNSVNDKPVYYWKNVTGGTIPTDAGQVILVNCTNVVVENQNISNASVGIALTFSSTTTVANNSVSDNQLGILVENSNKNTLVNNTASRNSASGIVLLYSSNTKIMETTALNNYNGIRLYYSNNITVINTSALYNDVGISVSSSDNNTIANNSIHSSRQTGISLLFSNNNSIYHNIFADNLGQAVDNTDTNQWDNGYPSGGNYWNDYNGTDNKSGPNQDVPGSDGIGDIPYIIDPDSTDRYPLISPPGVEHPGPPTLLQAVLNGTDLENITITWSLSPDDGKRFKSAVGYRVYRNMTYHADGLGYSLIASLPNGTFGFTDAFVGEGDPNNYFYQICSVDLNNNTSCSQNQAAKLTRPLAQGPNLVSIPLIQSNNSIDFVLQTVKWNKAWSYDPPQGWKWRMNSKPYPGELKGIALTQAIWVNVVRESNLTLAGIVAPTVTIHLHKGWNLVGFPSFEPNYTVADLRVAVAFERVEGCDLSNPPFFLRNLGDTDFLWAGYGYWIKVEVDTTWVIRNV